MSPSGSAAPTSSNSCVASGSCTTRSWKLASTWAGGAEPSGTPKAPVEPSRQQAAWQLEQGEWISVGLGDDPVTHSLVELPECRRSQQRSRLDICQPVEAQLRQTLEHRRLLLITLREQQQHRLGVETPGDERQRLRR